MEGVHGQHTRSAAPETFRDQRVHFIGIGGCGMQGVAKLLLGCGAKVSGSDVHPFPELGALTAAGAVVCIGHHAENVAGDVDLVVYSAAVGSANPELTRAREQSTRAICYAELIGELTAARRSVCIAGTHGKSTATGMTAYVLRAAGLDPSFIMGAESRQLGGRGAAGRGEHFVVESCEYNRSFLHFRPFSAAVLNIEADHLDYYRDLDDLVSAFSAFCASVPPEGLIVARHEDDAVSRATAGVVAKVETFGFHDGATWQAENLAPREGCYAFDLLREGRRLARAHPKLAGLHNVANALASAALAYHAGAPPDAIADALGSFEGVDRRMTVRCRSRGVTVVDDYAHHPTEIRATIRALQDRFQPKRTWAVFQPHQYSRTRMFMDRFAESLGDADLVLVPDIFGARDSEADQRSVGAADLVARIHSRRGQARYIPGLEGVTDHLEQNVEPGDLVLTLGAGDVWKVADGLVEWLRRAH